MEEKEREFVWLKKKDYLKQSILLKILYYIGVYRFLDCTKILKSKHYVAPDNIQFHAGGFYRAYMAPRWWNPLTWPLVLIFGVVVFVYTGLQNVFKMFDSKNFRLEESVNKWLYDTEGKRVY